MSNPIVPVHCGSCEYREMLEAKVAELETEIKALIHDLHAYMDTANAELNRAEKAEAKAAELRKENNDLMTLVIPELQLDLKEAHESITSLTA